MTRKEELIAMRGRDLIELANKLGVKVNASKNSLKESKMKVVERILLAEESEEIDENAISPWDEVTMYDWSEFDIFTKKVKKATKTTTRKSADIPVDVDKIAVLTELASAAGFEVLIRRKNAVALKKGKKRLIEMGIARGLFQIAAKPICVEGTDIEYRVMNGGDYISVKNLTREEAETVLNTMYENVPA